MLRPDGFTQRIRSLRKVGIGPFEDSMCVRQVNVQQERCGAAVMIDPVAGCAHDTFVAVERGKGREAVDEAEWSIDERVAAEPRGQVAERAQLIGDRRYARRKRRRNISFAEIVNGFCEAPRTMGVRIEAGQNGCDGGKRPWSSGLNGLEENSAPPPVIEMILYVQGLETVERIVPNGVDADDDNVERGRRGQIVSVVVVARRAGRHEDKKSE